MRECKIFFSHLTGLAVFFSRSPKRMQLLDEICQRQLPRVAPTRWNFTFRLLYTVVEKKDELSEIFEHIVKHQDKYDDDTVHMIKLLIWPTLNYI